VAASLKVMTPSKLGIDLFLLRNQTQLDAINALSKKELLQLSPQEIERMGALNCFCTPFCTLNGYFGFKFRCVVLAYICHSLDCLLGKAFYFNCWSKIWGVSYFT
jgi:hypothetical protein